MNKEIFDPSGLIHIWEPNYHRDLGMGSFDFGLKAATQNTIETT